ncbi:MAG: ABC transporter permease [Conexibacter sp.]
MAVVNGRELTAFAARRLAAMVGVLLALSFVVFALLQLAPGDPVRIFLGARPATPATVATIEAQHHLNDPFLVQYWLWLKGAVTLDFGTAIGSSQSVSSVLFSRLGLTLELGLLGFLIAMVCGVPLGILAALRERQLADRLVVGFSIAGVSTPAFTAGLILIYFLGLQLAWFPVSGAGSGGLDRLWHLTLPAIALAITAMALVVKLTRAGMVRSLSQDYIVFALARGIPARRILPLYAVRNALIPVITAGGILLGYTLTAAVLVEVTFGLPGIGSLLVESVNTKDIPTVQGCTMVFGFLIVAVNAVTDLLYRLVDPRVGFQGAS